MLKLLTLFANSLYLERFRKFQRQRKYLASQMTWRRVQMIVVVQVGTRQWCHFDNTATSKVLIVVLRRNTWIFSNYWARLSKVSWFVSGKRINYLPKPRQIVDMRDTEKSWYFAITEFNNCFIIPSLVLLTTKDAKSLFDSWGNRSGIFRKERGFNYAWTEYFLEQNYFGQWERKEIYMEW